MDNSFIALSDDLHTEAHCCGSLQTKRKVMCKNLGQKTKLKSDDIKTWVTGNMTPRCGKTSKM